MRSDAQKAADKKYDQSEKGKIANTRYDQSEKCKVTAACYARTEEGKAAARRYNQTGKGKMVKVRKKVKRKRNLGYKPVNNRFPGCVGHHIDKENVLFIPEKLHRSIRHRQSDPVSMQVMNNAVYEWLCTQGIL